ncbi:MAG: hypothetical protein IJ391_05520 [Clostridia bacterium]|nr:hypothetical protein [Clostridia bacterium]
MKKLMLTLMLMFFALTLTANADVGDINGAIYASDITAYINGVEVPSYNIGGRTVVVVEDITKAHYYNDKLRTLIIGDLSPASLVSGKNDVLSHIPGTKVANTYETDIKTYIYDTELVCYSLNGKMAVAIEDLGGDNTFTKTGGKYIWNAEARTISLETISHRSIHEIMNEKQVKLIVDDGYDATFVSDPFYYGSVSGVRIPKDGYPRAITVGDTVIGYVFAPVQSAFSVDDDGNVSLKFERGVTYFCFYPESVESLLADITTVQPTREEILAYYQEQMMTVIDSYETENYTFVYMTQPTPHGSTQFLRLITADGSVTYYENDFKSVSLHGTKTFDNVVIDKENAKVTFRYDRDYVIDLETGVMR